MKKWLYVCCFVLLAVLICTAAYAEDVAVLSDEECEHWRRCDEDVCYICYNTYTGSRVWHTYEYECDETDHWSVCISCGYELLPSAHSRYCDMDTCYYCNMTYTGDYVYHRSDEYTFKSIEDGHVTVYACCGMEGWWGEHSRRCDEDVCGACGAAYTGENVNHGESELKGNAEMHWYECTTCGEEWDHHVHTRFCSSNYCSWCQVEYTGNNIEHWYEYRSDADLHWRLCVRCGSERDREKHMRDCDESVCRLCDAAYTGDNVYHDLGGDIYGNLSGDDEEHWKICHYCGDESTRGNHVRYCNESLCAICERTYTGDYVWHKYGDEYQGDAQGHWRSCIECGEKTEKKDHVGYCNDLSVCSVCGAKDIVSSSSGSHQMPTDETKHNDISHEMLCERCGIYFTDAYVTYVHNEATCTENGYGWLYCTYCEEEFEYEIEAGHVWDDEANAEGQIVCKKCDEIQGATVKIVKQPVSVCVASGAKATVKFETAGDGLTYQWYVKTAGTSTFKKSATTSATYSVTMNATRNGNQVYCIVTDKYGSKAQTNTVTLTMAPELKITKQPSSVEVASGKTAKVTVEADGDGLTYQWYVKAKGASKFTKSSLTGSSYSVKMTSARNGNQVYCVVKDQYGSSVKTNTVTLTMKASGLKITKQPASVEVANGQTAKVSVTAEGEGLSYKWYVKAKGASQFTKSSLTGSSYSVKMTTARNGNQVYCVVTDKSGATVQSNTVTLTMKTSSLKITQQPVSVEVAYGKTAKVSVTAEGEGLSYKWYVKAKGTSTFKKSSLTGSSYSVTMTSARNGNQVYCIVTDKSGNTVQSNTVTLTMAAKLAITKQPVSVSVASGAKATVKVEATGDGLSYQWYVKAKGTSSFKKSSTTGATYSVTMTSARNGNQVYCIVTDKNGNTVQSNTVTLSKK